MTRRAPQDNVPFSPTGVFRQLAAEADSARIICLYGGSSSSKTISALQYLTLWGEESTRPLVISVIGESVPVIKKSVLRDWKTIVMQQRFDADRFNKQDSTYTFPSGSIMQFIPADDEMRFFAMRHDLALFDEAYNIPKGVFDQVEIRTRQQILLTWNPVSPFWGTHLGDTRDDVAVIHATYKDNPHVDPAIVRALEIRARTDPNFYRVFVLGEYGTLEGLIFKEGENWRLCDSLPAEYSRRVLVLDYGFSYDPTALLDVRFANGEIWAEEVAYSPGMFNTDIYQAIRGRIGQGDVQVVADSAEPKSNAELAEMGLNIVPAVKGPDSIKYGLNTMMGYRLNVTKSSVNTIKELRNYSWAVDRHGEHVQRPIDNWNHSIDALRYGITHMHQRPDYEQYAIS